MCRRDPAKVFEDENNLVAIGSDNRAVAPRISRTRRLARLIIGRVVMGVEEFPGGVRPKSSGNFLYITQICGDIQTCKTTGWAGVRRTRSGEAYDLLGA